MSKPHKYTSKMYLKGKSHKDIYYDDFETDFFGLHHMMYIKSNDPKLSGDGIVWRKKHPERYLSARVYVKTGPLGVDFTYADNIIYPNLFIFDKLRPGNGTGSPNRFKKSCGVLSIYHWYTYESVFVSTGRTFHWTLDDKLIHYKNVGKPISGIAPVKNGVLYRTDNELHYMAVDRKRDIEISDTVVKIIDESNRPEIGAALSTNIPLITAGDAYDFIIAKDTTYYSTGTGYKTYPYFCMYTNGSTKQINIPSFYNIIQTIYHKNKIIFLASRQHNTGSTTVTEYYTITTNQYLSKLTLQKMEGLNPFIRPDLNGALNGMTVLIGEDDYYIYASIKFNNLNYLVLFKTNNFLRLEHVPTPAYVRVRHRDREGELSGKEFAYVFHGNVDKSKIEADAIYDCTNIIENIREWTTCCTVYENYVPVERRELCLDIGSTLVYFNSLNFKKDKYNFCFNAHYNDGYLVGGAAVNGTYIPNLGDINEYEYIKEHPDEFEDRWYDERFPEYEEDELIDEVFLSTKGPFEEEEE